MMLIACKHKDGRQAVDVTSNNKWSLRKCSSLIISTFILDFSVMQFEKFTQNELGFLLELFCFVASADQQ